MTNNESDSTLLNKLKFNKEPVLAPSCLLGCLHTADYYGMIY